MGPDLRAQLLQRIHDDLDDDLARSVYADHLLHHETADAWHAELIQLQLTGGDPARVAQILHERKTRALGPLVRLFDVTWVRGFPERARTRHFTEEHVARLVESRHLPTLRSIELPYVTPALVPSLLSAPRAVTERVTELIVADANLAELAPLFASDQFPSLRAFGLRRDARTSPHHATTDMLEAVLPSTLATRISHLGIWSPPGERLRWVRATPPNIAQLDVFEHEYTNYTERAFSYVRGDDGVLAQAVDPVIPLAAQMGFFHTTNIWHLVETWPPAQLLALEQRLRRDGRDDEAEAVRELIDYPPDDTDT